MSTNIESNSGSSVISFFPFDSSSTLLVNNHIFPYDLIEDILVMIRDESVPLYISRITAGPVKTTDNTVTLIDQKDFGTLSVFIADSTGVDIAYFQLKRQQSVKAAHIKTLRGTLCGGIKLKDTSLYSWLYSMVKNTLYGELTLQANALILHPNTLACVSYTGYQGLSLNGVYLGNHIHLVAQHNVKAVRTDKQVRFDAFGDYDQTFEKTQKLQVVNGVDLRGKSLIIKSSTMGDLRVGTQTNKIKLLGVTDI